MTTGQSPSRRTIAFFGIAGVLVAAIAIGLYFLQASRRGLPAPSTQAYEQTTRHFYRGLAGLQVGLLDAAKQEFVQATTLAPGEPAVWADLGLTHLRLGEFDAAATALERASQLAPSASDVAFLRGRLETARGRREEGIVLLRRAIDLDARNLYARSALAQEIENAGGPNADAEAQQQLEALVALQPDSVALLVDRARLAAKRSDKVALTESIARLQPASTSWPPEVLERYQALQQAVAGGNPTEITRAVAFLRNVLARVPSFRESRRLVTPSVELIADPVIRFVRLDTPVSTPSASDDGLTFAREVVGGTPTSPLTATVAFALDGEGPPAIVASGGTSIDRVDAASPALATAIGAPDGTPSALLALDWNHDFKMDLLAANASGVYLFVQQADGTFSDETAKAAGAAGVRDLASTGAWAADIEMDGDLDVVVGVRDSTPVVLRNNGDGTWVRTQPFAGVTDVRAFAWGDVDGDGDPDAVVVGAQGRVQVLSNIQGGQFQPLPIAGAFAGSILALALGDIDADGALDVVSLDARGDLRRASLSNDAWREEVLGRWNGLPSGTATGAARVFIADLDNNGGLDVVASAASGSAAWLAGADRSLHLYRQPIDADVRGVLDLSGDGQLDLVGLSAGRVVKVLGRGTLGYHHQVVRPRAQTAAGDQRINSFGIGGEIEVRSGPFAQKQTIVGEATHFGLGTRTSVDVTRIVWPNGVPQAEFDPGVDRAIVAQQRLKGSCPWVFADDGSGMRFVTDFLWRSPLGLRINAQDTAGVTQTEDWVRIRGDQLVPRNGAYDIRITAELWETHFVDHASLMVVDHPADTVVFVDERFSRETPVLEVHAVRSPQSIARAWDQDGRDVTDLVARQDGRYLGTFARGPYQGVAVDHFVEVDLGVPIDRSGPNWLVAHGFVYPTDSSINVAIGQGHRLQPRGLSLEALDANGHWVVVAPDLGFPAGKNKTILIDLGKVAAAGVAGARRLRLRTNLEIYWDSVHYAASAPDVELRTARLLPAKAELRYRGYSETRTDRREEPEIPLYDHLANTAPRWRDLVGYYTRFGDVRELLEKVEDRYVIMNAGDEIRLSFTAPEAPAKGWTRDFVLIGDGWVKDGDFNTSYSKTVLPLPAHGRPEYRSSSMPPVLEEDDIYRRHSEDWQRFHTRFVAPEDFLRGLSRQ